MRSVFSVMFLSLCVVCGAFAEDNDAAAWATRYVAAKTLAAPLLRNATQAPSDAFKISAESGESEVAILLTREARSTVSSWHLKLASPVNKNGKRTTLADLKGLASDPTVEFGFGWSNKARAAENARTAKDTARAAAARGEQRALADPESMDAAEAWDIISAAMANAPIRRDKRAGGGDFLIRTERATAPETTERALLIDRASRTLVNAAQSAIWFIDGTAGVTRGSYDFADDAGQKTSIDRSSGKATLSGGFIVGSTAYYGGQATVSNGYKEQDAFDFCSPNGAANTLRCTSLAAGPPTHTTKRIASVEARFNGLRAGANPAAYYDVHDKVWGAELPLYLIRNEADKDNGFPWNGGVSFGWDSKTHHVAVAVFVGSLKKIGLP